MLLFTAVTITITIFTFSHLIASLHSGQDFLYHKCVPQWSIFTGATSSASSFLVKSFSHIDLIHLIIFLFLNSIEEPIGIFRFPFTCVFYIPFRSLDLPIWNFVFYRKRRYIPKDTIIRLCCIISIL